MSQDRCGDLQLPGGSPRSREMLERIVVDYTLESYTHFIAEQFLERNDKGIF